MKDDFPEYSEEGKLGLVLLHQYWAHAAFYCEDECHEIFYERLIRKIIPNIKDFFVVCLGGKSEIIKALKRADWKPPIPEIYIVDKDYDDFDSHFNAAAYRNLIYLRKHSIENYLAQFNAILEVILEQKATSGTSRFLARKQIEDSSLFYSSLQDRLIKIGRYFIVARKNGVRVKTSKISCDEIYKDSDEGWPLPTDEWESKYIADFKNACTYAHDWLLNDDTLSTQLSQAFDTENSPWGILSPSDHIVGKHLLGGVIRYMDSQFKTKLQELKDAELYTRLTSHIEINDLDYLKYDILKIAPEIIRNGTPNF